MFSRTKSNLLAVITGATGGIGRSFAKHLASQKYNLLLTDMDQKSLKAIAHELKKQYAVEVKTQSLNLTNEKHLSGFIYKLKHIGKIDMLVNCAGFGEGETFCNEKVEHQLKMIQVHITATVLIVHAILPGMIKQKKGKIITVASLSAFIPSPGSSIYAATKSFLNSFMESIYMEVSRYGIQVQSLCPGLTHTGFQSKLKKTGKRSGLNKDIPFMEADDVVNYSLNCLNSGTVVCIPGLFNRVVKNAIPVFPRKAFYAISKKIAEKNLKRLVN